MKICVPASGNSLESMMDNRFGRCKFFAFADDGGNVEFVENAAANADRGAGVQAAQFVLNKDTDVLVCDNLGGHAKEILEESGIKIIEASGITVKEAIDLALGK